MNTRSQSSTASYERPAMPPPVPMNAIGAFIPRSSLRCLLTLVALVLGILCATTAQLHATAFTVNALTDAKPTLGGVGSGTAGDLRYCITQANYGAAGSAHTITFTVTGTITLAAHELVVNSDTTITGPGAASLTIDANNASRVLYIAPSHKVAISGIAMTKGNGAANDATGIDTRGGSGWYGGAVYNDRSVLTLTGCTITASVASQHGGAIYNYARDANADLTISNCTISNNSSTYDDGGGIHLYAFGGDTILNITDSTISNNKAKNNDGGGISTEADGEITGTITNCAIIGNSAGGSGGGIYNQINSAMTITNSVISGNSATTNGGGICNYCTNGWGVVNALMTLRNCTVSGNSSQKEGGGIANITVNNANAMLTVNNCTISENTTVTSGAGIYNIDSGTLSVNNSTIAKNAAQQRGGGIFNYGDGYYSSTDPVASATVTNCTITGNSALSGGAGIANDNPKATGPKPTVTLSNTILALHPTGANYGTAYGMNVSGGFNLVDDASAGAFLTATGDQNSTLAGLQVDGAGLPLLSNNGGPTKTVALVSGGAAIDAGKAANDPATGLPATIDQRGITRAIDTAGVANATGGDGSDIGAFELGTPGIAVQQPAGTNIAYGSSESFGTVALGASASLSFTINNTGTESLTGLGITISGTDAAAFKVASGPVAQVVAGGSTTFTVKFTPSTTGAKTAALHIASNDANANPFDITLTGTGTGPDIAIEQPQGTGIPNVGSKDYGDVLIGSSVSLDFIIQNRGNEDLTGLTITRNGANASDFIVTALTTGTLAPGASTTFQVTFKPGEIGARTAAIHIASNDANENPFDISLTGNAIRPAPEIAVRQVGGKTLKDGKSELSFGNVPVKSKRTLSFAITNSGNAELKKLAVTVSGKNAENFTVNGPDMTTLSPGLSTTFTVTLKPSVTGKFTATIHIKSNDSSENPFDISLTGTGIKPKAAAATAKSTLAQQDISSNASERNRSFASTVRIDGGKYRCLTILRNGQAGPATDSVEVSSNLVDWFSGSAHTTVLEDSATALTVMDNTPVEPGRKRFIRLRGMP